MSDLTPVLARRILSQMGENGKPPEIGISHVNAGNDTYMQIIDQVYVEDVLRTMDGSSFKLVQGTYGSGKTHFLFCVRDLAWRRKLLTAFVTISPKECPFNKPLAVYKSVAQRLELPREDDEDEVRGIDDILRRIIEGKMQAGGGAAAKAWVDNTLARAPLTHHSFRDAAVRYLHAVVDERHASERRLAAWLRGESLPGPEAKAEGLYDVPSNEHGFGMLRSLSQLVKRLGYEGTVLLLDEAERRLSVESKPNKATFETIDHLREIVDLCGRSELPRTLILYAVTPTFTQSILPLYPALQQRLGTPLQYFSPHNPKAPLIDLEALDMEPKLLLREVGFKLYRVAQRAYAWTPNEDIVRTNLDRLTRTVCEEQLEVSHRRLFVKLWIRHLDELRLGGERKMAEDEVQALVKDEQAHLLREEPSGDVMTFFGEPVPRKDKDKPTTRSRRR
jgi:hypothetical protein